MKACQKANKRYLTITDAIVLFTVLYVCVHHGPSLFCSFVGQRIEVLRNYSVCTQCNEDAIRFHNCQGERKRQDTEITKLTRKAEKCSENHRRSVKEFENDRKMELERNKKELIEQRIKYEEEISEVKLGARKAKEASARKLDEKDGIINNFKTENRDLKAYSRILEKKEAESGEYGFVGILAVAMLLLVFVGFTCSKKG